MDPQRTHELWVHTENRGSFLVYRGPEGAVNEVESDLHQSLLNFDTRKGEILVKLPASEATALVIKEIAACE